MDLSFACRQIEKRLEKIDFAALFRGFHIFPFALYDDAAAFVDGAAIERPAAFLGNTSVMYNGRHTAIWKLTEEKPDFDVLTSKIVHEMLHAYQQENGETRWADERAALTGYRYDETFFSARLREADCMKRCLTENAPDAFERLLALRRARMERYPFAYDYEARIEQIEGTAHFVELGALKQLDAGKAERSWAALMETLADPARYFPVRAVTYLTGAAFLSCLRKYTAFDTDQLTALPFSAAALKDAQPCELPEKDAEVTASLRAWEDGIRETAALAARKNDLALEGTYTLVAWNVYDGVRIDRFAVLTAFLGYIEGETMPGADEELFAAMRVLHGNFVVDLDENLRFSHAWRW